MIDPQIHWVFNTLWDHNFAANQYIIFPHGPLSFLEFPMTIGKNAFIATLFRICLMMLFFFLLALHTKLSWNKKSIIILTAMFLFGQWLDFESLLAANVLLLLLLYDKSQSIYYLIASIILSIISIYVKISIGIICSSLLFSYFTYSLIKYKSSHPSLLWLSGFPIYIFLAWLVLYQSTSGFVDYWIGLKELTIGNSESAALYPDNNWYYLGLTIFSLLVIPFLRISKTAKMIYIVSFLSFLAFWKHSMSREDAWHIMKFFYWIGFVCFLIAYNEPKYWKRITAVSLVCLSSFYLNVMLVSPYPLLDLNKPSLKNISNSLFSEKKKNTEEKRKEKELSKCQLNPEDRVQIGNSTVDCYPYNYCFVAHNNLTWNPRPIIQSYAAYTPYLDKKNADYFASSRSPEYIIWEMDMLQRDRWNLAMTSIDGRYLPNDEPHTLSTILSQYKLISKREDYILLKKRKEILKIITELSSIEKIAWNTWVEIPETSENILLHIDIQKSIWAKLKSSLYKGEAIYILYKTEDDSILKYRFSKANAKEGLWISPFLTGPNRADPRIKIKAISINCNSPSLFDESIIVQWSKRVFKEQQKVIDIKNSIGISTSKAYDTLFQISKTTEQSVSPTKFSASEQIQLEDYSMDTLSTSLLLDITVDIKMPCISKALLVTEVLHKGERKSWDAYALDRFINQCDIWEPTKSIKNIHAEKGDNIKVYIWNTGKSPVSMKNFSVKLLREQQS